MINLARIRSRGILTLKIRRSVPHEKYEIKHPPRVMYVSRKLLAPVVLCVLLPGCVRLGERLERDILTTGKPKLRHMLECLGENDSGIRSFQASGTFTVESPQFGGKRQCKGKIVYRKPTDLYIRGRHKTWGFSVLLLTCVGAEFLLEFPRHKEKYYYREGMQFEGVPFSVSPADIVREVFFPESWEKLRRKEVRLVGYDNSTQSATIEIGPANRPRRRVVVEGPPWVVTRSELLDERGGVRAITVSSDYHVVEGLRFPRKVETEFPAQQTRMTFELRAIQPNTELDDSLFLIEWQPEYGDQPDRSGPAGDRGAGALSTWK